MNEKLFTCSFKGCEMTFTNEQDLNWHVNRHDMMLNLSLANKNADCADQTPTPTRFIRNCEEVGLFQDLQNVNPFDEMFKKAAVEYAKTGMLPLPETTSSDDTLHTPHIFPHVEEIQPNKFPDINTNDFNLNNVIPTITVQEDENITQKDDSVKEKIKEVLKIKGKNGNNTPHKLRLDISKTKSKARNDNTKNDGDSKEKIREMNRAAQLRCRKRRQQRISKMEQDNLLLRQENKRLQSENFSLKSENTILKELVLKYENERTGIVKSSEQIPTNNPVLIQIVPAQSNGKMPVAILPAVNNVPVISVIGEKKSVVLQHPNKMKQRWKTVAPKPVEK